MPGTCATQTSRSRARPVTPQNAQQRGGAGEEVFQGHVPSLQHGQGWWTLEIPAFFLGTWRPEYGHWLPSRRHFPVSSVTTTNTEPPSSRVTATHTAARGHRRPGSWPHQTPGKTRGATGPCHTPLSPVGPAGSSSAVLTPGHSGLCHTQATGNKVPAITVRLPLCPSQQQETQGRHLMNS